MSERKFSGGSEEVTSHLYQTYPDRSQPSSDVFCPQEDLRTQLRKMEAGASDKDKVEAPTGIMEMCSIFYCTDKCEKRKRTIARFVSCIFWIRIELSRCIHIFLQCITSGAKMLRVLFFVGRTFMKVARHDTITKISGLVGKPCVCQLCVGWRYHQMVSRLTSFSQHGRASTFWKSKMRGNCRASHFGDAIRGMYSSSVSVGVVHVLFARAHVQSTM